MDKIKITIEGINPKMIEDKKEPLTIIFEFKTQDYTTERESEFSVFIGATIKQMKEELAIYPSQIFVLKPDALEKLKEVNKHITLSEIPNA